MSQNYSIAEARHNLAALVHDLDNKESIQLTRRGEPVAVLLSMRAYRRLTEPKTDFWEAYQAFCRAFPLSQLNIQPDLFNHGRDTSPGREVNW